MMREPSGNGRGGPTLQQLLIEFTTHLDRERIEEAATSFRALSKLLARESVPHHVLEAMLRLAQKDPGASLRLLKRAQQKEPANPLVWQGLARAHRALGHLAEAEQAFKRTIELMNDPAHDVTLVAEAELAATLVDAGRATEAKAEYDRILDSVRIATSASKSGTRAPVTPQSRPAVVDKILYLPIEVKKREFQSRILLTVAALKAGFEVVVGPKWAIQNTIAQLPKGIVLFKTMNGIDAGHIAAAARNGHFTVALDEEAFGRIWTERNSAANVHLDALSQLDLICAQNEQQVDVLRAVAPGLSAAMTITGNPRADLYRRGISPLFHREISEIENRFGRPIILFTSMFGNIRPEARGFEAVARDLTNIAYGAKLATAMEVLRDATGRELALYDLFRQSLIEAARAFPDHTIILRPHPVENTAAWIKIAEAHPNIAVMGDGPIQAWLAAADAMVFVGGCTTGLEARLTGKYAVRLESKQSPPAADCISTALGQLATSPDEVVTALKSALQKQAAPLTADETETLINFIGASEAGLASERIVAACLAQFSLRDRHDGNASDFDVLRQISQPDDQAAGYMKNKFPGIARTEMRDALLTAGKLLHYTDSIDISDLNHGAFHIRSGLPTK